MAGTTLLESNRNYTPLILIIAIPCVIAILNVPVLKALWKYSFDDGTYSHAYLIPIIYLYLCYELFQNRQLVMRNTLSVPATILFILSSYSYYVLYAAQISLLFWIANILLIIASTVLLFRYHWKLVFPAAYLVFMYPLWGPLSNLLQDLSVVAVSLIMGYTGIPTYVEAQFVTIPAGRFEIAEGCSGLRYIIAALAISSLYIFLYLRKAKQIIPFLLFTIVGALLTNWIRIAIIIVVGHYTDMTSDLIGNHNMFGWYLFIPFMILLFVYGNYISEEVSWGRDHDLPTAGISYISVGIAIVGFIITSTSLTYVINGGSRSIENLQLEGSNSQISFHPTVPGYVNLKSESLDIGGDFYAKLTFSFDGVEFDKKPTSIENQWIGQAWQLVRRQDSDTWGIFIYEKQQQYAIVAISYQVGSQQTSSVKQFKLQRLRNALLGGSSTVLHWLGKVCQSDCQYESNQIADLQLGLL